MNIHHGSKGKKQREKIMRIAAKLMNREGYDGASLQKICDTAKIHKSTFFYYFKTKQELLNAVLEKPVSAILEAMDAIINNNKLSPREKLNLVILNHIILLTKYIDNLTIYNRELRHLSLEKREKYLKGRKQYLYSVSNIIDAIKESNCGYFIGLDSKIVALGILGMCNWTDRWYKKKGPLNASGIANIFSGMLTQGFNLEK